MLTLLCPVRVGQSLFRQAWPNSVAYFSRNIHLSFSCNTEVKRTTSRKPVFPVLDGRVDTTSDPFQTNTKGFLRYVDYYEKSLEVARSGGGEKGRLLHTKRNKKLLVEDRLKLLLDEDSPFLELSVHAGLEMPYKSVPRAGVLIGIGKINEKLCMIIANDGSVKGGTIFPITLKKQLRAQEIAQQNRIPCVYVVDSGGAFLPLQSEIFNPGGQAFYNEAVMSSLRIPQLAVVCGSCTAGGAYVPTMADEAVIVHRIGTIFLGGPPLVQAATGEVVTSEELGGATLHSSVSGCTDYFADTEADGFATVRDIVATLNLPDYSSPVTMATDPLHDPQELPGIIPAKDQHEMDIYKVIARLVDGSRFSEFKTKFGSNLVTGFAHLEGYLVGIVGNNGSLTDTAAAKGAHFVQMCSERNIPIIFLQNTSPADADTTTGVEGGNLLRDHAKMMAMVSCTTVPKLTVVIGNSIGPSGYIMGGRCTSPNFIFAWPNAKIGITEERELVDAVCQERLSKPDMTVEEKTELEKKIHKDVQTQMSAFYSSFNVFNDGLILPQDTRKVLGQCLEITSCYLPKKPTNYPVVRM